jgi:predicted RNA-binding protein with PIN domain
MVANKCMLVVDAYNALHVTGVLPPELAGLEVHELAELVSASRWGRHRVVLVCDGTRPKGQPDRSSPGVSIRYSGGGVTADATIEQLLQECSHPRRLTVVSNDHQVQRSARKRRARVLTSDTWLHQLAMDHARPASNRHGAGRRGASRRDFGPLTPQQAEAWLRYFGVEPE